MDIDIVGEDEVTKSIIERLISDYRKDINIKERFPARGGQLKSMAPKFNKLDAPVFLLTDLDEYQCPPSLIKDWLDVAAPAENLLFRIAQEESETWLMADREGFSKWLGVDVDLIPEPTVIDRRQNIMEILLPVKPSLYMMLEIASRSPKENIRESLLPKNGSKKGPMYNSVMTDFIQNHWNVGNAASNSYSLAKTITRLQTKWM